MNLYHSFLLILFLLNVGLIRCVDRNYHHLQRVLGNAPPLDDNVEVTEEEPDAETAAATEETVDEDVCKYSDWSAWSNCTLDACGSQMRSRNIIEFPSDPNEKCPLTEEVRLCNTQPECEADCVVSPWTAWLSQPLCPNQVRHRAVVKPASEGGKPCPPPADMKEWRRPPPIDLSKVVITEYTFEESDAKYYWARAVETEKDLNSTRAELDTAQQTLQDALDSQDLAAEREARRTIQELTTKYQQLNATLGWQWPTAYEWKVKAEVAKEKRLKAEAERAKIVTVPPTTRPPKPTNPPRGWGSCSQANGDVKRYRSVESFVPTIVEPLVLAIDEDVF
eukprot:TRINITY_DN5474_c0_g2_i1.p1 TRINITY_DN5474_c0_g2~~TRINITY_DN5474_c0_g2_i1.p1  ORF type:complete len:336 (+),score=56.55 TRINITY_DN5474_c0_g2_i1:74-1081(+)